MQVEVVPVKLRRIVPCPFCKRALYGARSIGAKVKNWIPLTGGPLVESFHHGSFVICPHCFARVAVAAAVTRLGLGFRVVRDAGGARGWLPKMSARPAASDGR